MRSSQREVPSKNAWYRSTLCILGIKGKRGLERMKRVPAVCSACMIPVYPLLKRAPCRYCALNTAVRVELLELSLRRCQRAFRYFLVSPFPFDSNKQDGASIPHSPWQSVRENSPTVPVTPPLTPIGEKRCTPMTIKRAMVRSPPSPICAPSLIFPSLPFLFFCIFPFCVCTSIVLRTGLRGLERRRKKERGIVSFIIFVSEPFTFFGFLFQAGQRPPSPPSPEPHIHF
ncbi:unnamed protein product [Tuber melanosporum]|uniref:(Perigord truffle) hypothetical protein n=1 Tax=Tuber melanosporum (strain Mel28) TaxID=656061 RepID=D5G9Q9_TUBMM|nr:uncharacterized protein GSTUM_00005031001 [Tuber melanosporum]CAZ81252.1 unnamed protein product [Tuber melanosporum]